MKTYITSRTKNVLTSVQSILSLNKAKAFVHSINSVAFRILSIATGKFEIGSRLQRLNKLLILLLKVHSHHGSEYVVKWLKASHIAVQRKLSSKPVKTLRELEPKLPLPRLINGLPSFIGTMDRQAIRQGHTGTIRFWLTVLSLYRVINTVNNLKLNTITDPWTGNRPALDKLAFEIEKIIDRNKMKRKVFKIQANMLHKTTKAGPNTNNSLIGLLTDAYAWKLFPDLRAHFADYAKLTGSGLDSLLSLWGDAAEALYRDLGYDIFRTSTPDKGISSLYLGKLSFKLEPAGKVRVFAIVDTWTQSLLKPLHEDLFVYLSKLPNDGTFDQDRSFDRCKAKAAKSNMAFCFDLTAATDRLPIELQIHILNILYCYGVGDSWAKLLVDRDYIIRSSQFEDLQGDIIRYATGQPMGCLSSWAMLAVTHHLIMQVAANRVYGSSTWYDNYEVLGDDIVIFDNHVAAAYLLIMSELGVGINLSKSLISEQLETIEFAKRTAVKGIDVSGLSWRQFISESALSGRVSLAISLLRKGYIADRTMLVRAIASPRYFNFQEIFNKSKLIREQMEFGIVSILGSFTETGKTSLGAVVSLITDPSYLGGVKGFKPSVPIVKSLQHIFNSVKVEDSNPIETEKRKNVPHDPSVLSFNNLFHKNPVQALSTERLVDQVQYVALYKAKRMLAKFERDYESKLENAVRAFLNDRTRNPYLARVNEQGPKLEHNRPFDPLSWLSKTQKLIMFAITEKALLRDAILPEALNPLILDFERRLDTRSKLPCTAVDLLRKVEFLVTSFDVDKEAPIYGSETSLPSLLKELASAKSIVIQHPKSLSKIEQLMKDLEDNKFMIPELMAEMSPPKLHPSMYPFLQNPNYKGDCGGTRIAPGLYKAKPKDPNRKRYNPFADGKVWGI